MEDKEIDTWVTASEGERRVCVSAYEDEGVWLSITVKGGSAYCSLTIEEAQQVIAGMQRVIDAQKVAA